MRPPSRRNSLESSGNLEPPTIPEPGNPSEFQTRAWSLIHELYLSNRGRGAESVTALVPKFCHLLREVAGSEYSPNLPSCLVRSLRTIREILSAEGIHSQLESMYQRISLRSIPDHTHYTAVATELFHRHRFNESLHKFRLALELSPPTSMIRRENISAKMGHCNFRMGRYTDALRHYELCGPNTCIVYLRVVCMRNLGMPRGEIDEMIGKLSQLPDCHRYISLLTTTTPETIHSLEWKVAHDPSNASAHSRLGARFYEGGLVKESEKHFRASLDISVNNVSARYNLGLTLRRQGRIAESIKMFERLPRNPCALYQLYELYLEQGNRERAKLWLILLTSLGAYKNDAMVLKKISELSDDPRVASEYLEESRMVDPTL